MSDSKQQVLAFIDAWNRLDYDAIYAAMADDIFYHNIPMEPCVGIDAVKAFFDGSGMGSDGAEGLVHHIVAEGDTVLTERTDKFRINGQWIIAQSHEIGAFASLDAANLAVQLQRVGGPHGDREQRFFYVDALCSPQSTPRHCLPVHGAPCREQRCHGGDRCI